ALASLNLLRILVPLVVFVVKAGNRRPSPVDDPAIAVRRDPDPELDLLCRAVRLILLENDPGEVRFVEKLLYRLDLVLLEVAQTVRNRLVRGEHLFVDVASRGDDSAGELLRPGALLAQPPTTDRALALERVDDVPDDTLLIVDQLLGLGGDSHNGSRRRA